VSSGKTIIEAKGFYFGNDKGAIHYEPKNKATATVELHGPGSSLNYELFTDLSKLKAGSLLINSPSIIFRWGKNAVPPAT
jgi:hypothetical protein